MPRQRTGSVSCSSLIKSNQKFFTGVVKLDVKVHHPALRNSSLLPDFASTLSHRFSTFSFSQEGQMRNAECRAVLSW